MTDLGGFRKRKRGEDDGLLPDTAPTALAAAVKRSSKTTGKAKSDAGAAVEGTAPKDKKKSKRKDAPADGEGQEDGAQAADAKPAKKAKRAAKTADDDDASDAGAKKSRSKGSSKEAAAAAAAAEPEEAAVDADGKPAKKRYLVFAGNIPFHVTKAQIEERFGRCGKLVDVRLMTKKNDGSFKGCCFIEFADAEGHHKALLMHNSTFEGRPINVEMTVGGGGAGAARLARIDAKNKKQREERQKMAKEHAARAQETGF